MADVDDLLSRARPRSEPFELFLDTGDDAVAAYDALVDELAGIPDDDDHKQQRAKVLKKLKAANDALRADHVVSGRMQALPYLRWEQTKGQFPPRDDNLDDAVAGVDRSALPRIVRECIMEPTFSDAQFERLLSVVPGGEWERLFMQARALNERPLSIPKLPSA